MTVGDGLGLKTRQIEPSVTVLEVSGDLVVSTMRRLEQALQGRLAAGDSAIILDLAEVGHIDTPGLALLYRLAQRCADANRALAVAGLPSRFETLTRQLHLDRHVEFTASIEEAQARIDR